MESTLLPAADRLRHRRQDDVSCIFSSHSAMMLCGGPVLSPRPLPPRGARELAAMDRGDLRLGVLHTQGSWTTC